MIVVKVLVWFSVIDLVMVIGVMVFIRVKGVIIDICLKFVKLISFCVIGMFKVCGLLVLMIV